MGERLAGLTVWLAGWQKAEGNRGNYLALFLRVTHGVKKREERWGTERLDTSNYSHSSYLTHIGNTFLLFFSPSVQCWPILAGASLPLMVSTNKKNPLFNVLHPIPSLTHKYRSLEVTNDNSFEEYPSCAVNLGMKSSSPSLRFDRLG